VSEGGADNKDELWIEKYRAAMRGAPIKKSRWSDLRKKATSVRDKLLTHMQKIFSRSVAEKRRSPEPAVDEKKSGIKRVPGRARKRKAS
jgi:hypothetical protein